MTGSMPDNWGRDPKREEAERQERRNNKEVIDFFKKLGYRMGWDFNRARGQEWHELYDENGYLVAQIDMGVPLKYIVEDMISWHKGEEPSDYPEKPDWVCSGPQGPEMKELFKRVYNFKMKGQLPNGQLLFPI